MTADFALTDAEISALDEPGWFLRDGVLGLLDATGVHDAIESLAAAGRLRPAGLGRGAARRVDGAVRGDAIAWIDPGQVPRELAGLWAVFLGSARLAEPRRPTSDSTGWRSRSPGTRAEAPPTSAIATRSRRRPAAVRTAA